MRLRDLLRRSEPAAAGHPYRAAGSEPEPTEVLARFEARLQALHLEVLELRRRLAGTGAPPVDPVYVSDLLAVVDVLDGLARGDGPQLNTVELRWLAASVRALLTYTEEL